VEYFGRSKDEAHRPPGRPEGSPEFRQAADRALKAGKPIVALKVGRGERTPGGRFPHRGHVRADALYEAFFRQKDQPVFDVDERSAAHLLPVIGSEETDWPFLPLQEERGPAG
jgi:hypothetical protein